MEQMVALLQSISQTAYKSQETVKTIESYPEISDTFYIKRLNLLLGEIHANSIRAIFKVISKGSNAELKDCLMRMCKSMKFIEEIHTDLEGILPTAVPDKLREWLDKNLNSLKSLFTQLIPTIEGLFDEGETRAIFSSAKDSGSI